MRKPKPKATATLSSALTRLLRCADQAARAPQRESARRALLVSPHTVEASVSRGDEPSASMADRIAIGLMAIHESAAAYDWCVYAAAHEVGDEPATRVDRRLRAGQNAVSLGEWVTARQWFEDAGVTARGRLPPTTVVDGFTLAAECSAVSRDPLGAAALLARALEALRSSSGPETQALRARLRHRRAEQLVVSGDLESALVCFERAAAEARTVPGGRTVESSLSAAAVALGLGRIDRARTQYRHAIAAREAPPGAMRAACRGLALCALKEGRLG